jgi:hypothetical protein
MAPASLRQNASRQVHRGFVLQELIAVLLLLVAAVALAGLPLDDSRRLARVGEDLSHFREIARLTQSFAAERADLVWTYTWRGGFIPNTPYPDLNIQATSDLHASQLQYTYLLRAVGNRPEIPFIANVIAHPLNSHLVLAELAGLSMPNRLFTAAGDVRTIWADDPAGYDQGIYTPNLGIGGANMRHPYGSSFLMGTCFVDRSAPGYRIYPQDTRIYVIPGNAELSPQAWSSIAFPSQKAFIHDRIARYFGPRAAWHTMQESRLPVLMADGSAMVRDFAEGNSGANPNNNVPIWYSYVPSPVDPPLGGPNSTVCKGGPAWTRGGILGRDFGGPEVAP